MKIKAGALTIWLLATSIAAASAAELSTGFASNCLIARQAEAQGDWALATDALAQLSAHDTDNVELLHHRAVLLLNQGRFDEAVQLAHQIIARNQKLPLADLILFAQAARQSDLTGASRILSNMSTECLGQFLRPLLGAWMAKDLRTAQQSLSPLRRINSFDHMISLHLGLIAARSGDVTAARPYFARTVLGDPNYRNLSVLAGFYEREGLDEQLSTLKADALKAGVEPMLVRALDTPAADTRVTTLREGVAEVLYDISVLLQVEGANDVALPYLRIATALRPDFSDAQFNVGEILQRLGHNQEAREIFTFLSPIPGIGDAAQLRVAALETLVGETDTAMAHLEEMVSDHVDWTALWYQLGSTAQTAGHFDRARQAYAKALEIVPPEAASLKSDILLSLASLEQQQHNLQATEDALRSAIALTPNNVSALNYLGYFWANRGVHLEEAEALVSRALNQQPNNPSIVDSLGWVKFRRGQNEEAVRYLELAAELKPYDATIHDHLGDAYWTDGREREARFQWQRSLTYREDEEASPATLEELRRKITLGLPSRQTAANR